MVILLLIVIAIVGAAYVFISGLESGLTSKAIEITGVYCSDGIVNVVIKNIGKEIISLPTDLEQTEPYDPDGDTIALYHMDETTGTIAYDSSLNSLDGTLMNGMSGDDNTVGGRFDNALQFNRPDSNYIELLDDSKFDPLTEVTIEAWIKFTDDTDWQPVFVYSESYQNMGGYNLIHKNPEELFGFIDGVTSNYWIPAFNLDPPLNDNQWHHVALTYDGTEGRLYTDGTVIDETIISLGGINSSEVIPPPRIGALLSTSDYFSGVIDEVRISSKARDFTVQQPGWFYACDGNDCNDLEVEKIRGNSSTIYFDRVLMNPGQIAVMKNSCTDACSYLILAGGRVSRTTAVC